MKFATILYLLFGFFFSSVTSEEKKGNELTSRIVGGVSAKFGEYPFAAGWYRRFSRYPDCGGSLIAPNLVITAAHCDGINGLVKVGCDLATGPCNGEANVLKKIKHPDFVLDRFRVDYDLMILKLDKDIDSAIINVNFDRNSDPSEGDMMTVIGWGTKSENGRRSINLQKVDVPLVSTMDCRRQYGSTIKENVHICAGYKQGGKDSCQGDSGGPLFETSNGITTQVGVVSFGAGCARPNKSGVYSRLSGSAQWIKQTICSEISGEKPEYCSTLKSPTAKPSPQPPLTNSAREPTPTLASQRTKSPTNFPTISPTISPTRSSSAAPTTSSPTTSFPTRTPTTPPTKDYIVCDNRGPQWMLDNNIECGSIESNLAENCQNEFWIRGKYCQLSCFVLGLGYPGDRCSNSMPDNNDETITDNFETIIEESTGASATTIPPSTAPPPPVHLVDNNDDNCIVCDDKRISWMDSFGVECQNSPSSLERKCNKNQNWIDNKYCQQSCYKAGYGYEGDICCNAKSPSAAPTLSPTVVPEILITSSPTKNCEICSDEGTTWMQDVGMQCKYSNLVEKKCNKNKSWRDNKTCQYSCYHRGYGYDGDNCCS